MSLTFKEMVRKEVYGSIFYMFMRDDKYFIDNFHTEIKRKGYFVKEF